MTRPDESLQQLVEQYKPFVERCVDKLMTSMHLPFENKEEYYSAAYLGLVEAASRYNPEVGSDFRSFAYLRVRGAVIDSIRKNSHLSGRAYHCARAVAAIDIERSEIAANAGNSAEDRLAGVFEFASKSALIFQLSANDVSEDYLSSDSEQIVAEEVFHAKQIRKQLRECLTYLDSKERLILTEYYFNDKSFSQIVDEHPELSKSWVSRLHSRALKKLPAILEEHSCLNRRDI